MEANVKRIPRARLSRAAASVGRSRDFQRNARFVGRYFGSSIKTIFEFWRERSNTMYFPSDVMSSVGKVP